jgi:hypothetical protein
VSKLFALGRLPEIVKSAFAKATRRNAGFGPSRPLRFFSLGFSKMRLHCDLAKAVRGSIATALRKRSDETIFRIGRQILETMPCATWCHCKGGVMDIIVALLLLVSVGVFALHILDALRAS